MEIVRLRMLAVLLTSGVTETTVAYQIWLRMRMTLLLVMSTQSVLSQILFCLSQIPIFRELQHGYKKQLSEHEHVK